MGINNPKTEATEASLGSGAGQALRKYRFKGASGGSFGPNLSHFATAEASIPDCSLRCGTSLERIAAESLTRSESSFVPCDI
jgi:hypothetical protein